MPRWKALPEELDPQVREFAGHLRRLVDRSGLSLAAVADRTGYSKTSWERYLNGRLLAPKGAIVALAEVTGTQLHHLTTMWELAERAWSRSEMRHDMTMEAIRISQARAALNEAGVAAAPVASRRAARTAGGGTSGAGAAGGTGVSTAGGPAGEGFGAGRPSVPVQRSTAPRIPQQPHPGAVPDSGGSGHLTGGGPGGRKEGGRRRLPLFLAGAVGALLLIAGAVLLLDPGGDDDAGAAAATPSAEPTAPAPQLPAGVECSGADCTGQDPEAMGCGGEFAGTVARATVGGGLVEVRYSETCGAAWARITQASPGDTVKIMDGSSEQEGTVDADADAYTPMVAVKKASDAKACATLASGTTGCTTPE
ncbi:XRE family transcriptional regulator [Streptomyces sp. IBSNAI001]|uniref:XRE family transcriptional regulator n=1 Tax=Streptomyces sp. IBSNAI001 TaxID=3457499 RepID=UPI003FD196E5